MKLAGTLAGHGSQRQSSMSADLVQQPGLGKPGLGASPTSLALLGGGGRLFLAHVRVHIVRWFLDIHSVLQGMYRGHGSGVQGTDFREGLGCSSASGTSLGMAFFVSRVRGSSEGTSQHGQMVSDGSRDDACNNDSPPGLCSLHLGEKRKGLDVVHAHTTKIYTS